MQRLGLSPSSFALSSSLKSCAKMGHELGGFVVHSLVYRRGFSSSVFVLTSLMDFYSKNGDLESARKVFDEMPVRNVVSWNSLLSGYLGSGDMENGRRVFEEIPEKDAVSWNAMITWYARAGDMDRSVEMFDLMPERNLGSWNAVVSGFANLGDMESARSVFELMPERNAVSSVAVISGYSKIGDFVSARLVFDRMRIKELYAYNAMIACYEKNNCPKEAIGLFNLMLKPDTNVQPDESTLTSVVSACSQLGYMEFGLYVESYAENHGIHMDYRLTNAFVDLFSKSGNVEKAYTLFRRLKNKDRVSYSAMISGFGVNGKPLDAISLFREMVEAGISPNLVTYKSLLAAYSHAGLIEEGYECFESMKEHGLIPSVDHYSIMVDLLARSGRLDKGYELINTMLVQPNAGVWGALLLGCKLHNNVELGEICAKKCFELLPERTGYPSLLANIYASVERWDDVGKLRNDVDQTGFVKTPGCSWIESK